MRASKFAAFVVVVLGCAPLAAQEKVDNPSYASWAKFKLGTSVTLKTTTTGAMFNSEATMVMKLAEVTADKVVLEVTSVSKVNGMEFKAEPMKQDVPKQVELPKGVKKETVASGKPEGTTKEGEEKVKVGGTEVKSKWYEYSVKANGADVQAKMWTSDDVPGMFVKSESKFAGPMAFETKMELVEFVKK